MKYRLCLLFVLIFGLSYGQDETKTYKKRVLESTEVDFLSSYYSQDGDNASITGGVGTEKLTDVTPTIVISIPLNADDVLTVDAGISAYTSASSSNLDPFDASGASGGDDDDDDDEGRYPANAVTGSPWVASSGASAMDIWGTFSLNYSHSSDDRNDIWSAHAGISAEYDYFSFGFGGGFAKLFNQKNTEIGISGQIYLDKWLPEYPTELNSYLEAGSNLNNGFFSNIDILNQNGDIVPKNGSEPIWSPVVGFDLIQDKTRRSYSASFSFSQILSKNAQISLFMDVVHQEGWLANPSQRVYFGDRPNYYIGNASSIPNYTSRSNTDVFQLADDFERLPNTRFKTPIGMRLNYFINETFVLRTYYRYYFDNWGMTSHTASVEIPIKLGDKFTIYPSYRYYTQTAIDNFAPFEENLSTQDYYTSDYDLSAFDANQYGLGLRYTDIFTKMNVWKFGLKSIDVRYQQYDRTTGLTASIISAAFKFVMD